MPLSNVFRHTFPNPFHRQSRKSRHAHAHSGNTTGSSTSIVVVPVVESNNKVKNTVNFSKPLPSIPGRSDSRKSVSLKDKGKDKDDGKPRQKGSQATSKSAHSSLSACHLERLDADTIPRASSPSDVISKLQISKAPPSPDQHMSALPSPTSTSFSPSPLSPHIRMPSSPSPPSTPSAANSARHFSSSPEPLSPIPTGPLSPSRSGTIGSRFGSLFSNKTSRRDIEERILSEQEPNATLGKENVGPAAMLKKKRLSTGSIHIPIGAFLTNTFRSKLQQGSQLQQQQSTQQQVQSVQEQEHDQTQQPPQRKKRRGLLPKLPKLDTRPRIAVSRSGSKKQKEAKLTAATGHGDYTQTPPEKLTQDPAAAAAPGPRSDAVPGISATATRRPGVSRSSSLKASPKLLSPFYLPPQIRTGAGSHLTQHLDPNVRLPPPMMTTTREKNDCPTSTTTSIGSQAGQQLLDVSFNPVSEWQHDSQVFYDDRWDRASVRTVDTEIIRLSDDPSFPGYPERNDYWQQHCRIRERRWKHQIHKHQQQQLADARSPKKWLNGAKADPVTGLTEDDTNSLLEEDEDDDESRSTDHDGPLADRLRDVTDLLNSLPEKMARRSRQSTAPQSSQQSRFRQRRDRYTTYSAYIAAMQVKSKSRTDHKRSLDIAAMASPNGSDTNKLMADVRALRERSMTQPTNVKETADMFGGAVMGDDPIVDACLDPTRQSSLPEVYHGQRRYARHHNGINLGSSDDESEDQYEAEDCVHPISSFNTLQRQRQPDSGILFVAAAATTAEVYPTLLHDPREQQQQQLRNRSSARSKMDHLHFHDKHTSTTNCWIEDGYDEGMIGCLVASFFDKSFLEDRFKSGDMDDDESGDRAAGGTVGNGFMVLQSSFGDQGSPDGLSGPKKRDDAGSNNINNYHTNDKNSDDDTNSHQNNNDNNNNYSNSKKDLCLSRPGQYASHNHIMPLEQLLELEGQERQRRRRLLLQQQELDRQKKLVMMMEQQQQQQLSIYLDGALDATSTTKPTVTTSLPSSATTTPSQPSPSSLLPSFSTITSSSYSSSQFIGSNIGSGRGDTFLSDPSTATSVPTPSSTPISTPTSTTDSSQQQPTTDSESTPPSQTQTQQQPRRQSSGYMLLVLDQGRCQYYENGTRKRGPQWDQCEEQRPEEDSSSHVGHDATGVIEEEMEEVDEEELAWRRQQRQRQEFSPHFKRSTLEKGKGKSVDRDTSRAHLIDEPAVQEQGPNQEVEPLGSLTVIDSPLSPRFAAFLSESPTVSAKSSQVFSAHPSRSSTPNSENALAPRPQSMVATPSPSLSSANPSARLASANGLSNLSRIRAVKSRASLSYSVLPTLSTTTFASSTLLTAASASSSASTSTTTLLNDPSLKHRASGSMIPSSTLYSGGGIVTLATPASLAAPAGGKASLSASSSSMPFPGRKLSWSDPPSKPTLSASALLLDALLRPVPSSAIPQDGDSTTTAKSTEELTRNSTKNDPAQRWKQQWDQKMRSQSVKFMSPSAMAARSRSMLLSPPPMTISGSRLWMRNSVHLLASPPHSTTEGADSKSRRLQDQRQRRQGALSEADLDSQHIETEADQEMEEELRKLLDDATSDDSQYLNNKNNRKSGVAETRKARRALSMVELSASTSASQYKAALPTTRTRERYKAEASTSTSTVATLTTSEGMYQWSEFFDI
ncbi:hypothetical protein BGX24_006137 [Mortierella sp. AD032]|nr:hypothetical protein BGX24_006137 [Mortierella sp. AD032]